MKCLRSKKRLNASVYTTRIIEAKDEQIRPNTFLSKPEGKGKGKGRGAGVGSTYANKYPGSSRPT